MACLAIFRSSSGLVVFALGASLVCGGEGFLSCRLFRHPWHSFSYKGQESKYFSFVGHTVSVTSAQLCFHEVKAAIDYMYTNEHGCVPMQLYL